MILYGRELTKKECDEIWDLMQAQIDKAKAKYEVMSFDYPHRTPRNTRLLDMHHNLTLDLVDRETAIQYQEELITAIEQDLELGKSGMVEDMMKNLMAYTFILYTDHPLFWKKAPTTEQEVIEYFIKRGEEQIEFIMEMVQTNNYNNEKKVYPYRRNNSVQ